MGVEAFDDEGTPTERTVLFADGELVNLLYDRVRAEQDGVPSTGNGRRQSYASLPIPRMRNSFILGGESRPEDVVSGTPSGLYAAALGGGQVNPATGDFVFGVAEGYLIEDGSITAPVRGANLIGNGPTILAGDRRRGRRRRDAATACAARRGRGRPCRTAARRSASPG